MSLDITLTATRPTSVFESNITHNLAEMADQAELYKGMWRPEELGITKAAELIPLLEKGLSKLLDTPYYYKQFNPKNGWGNYEGLVNVVTEYLQACKDNPDAEISVWR